MRSNQSTFAGRTSRHGRKGKSRTSFVTLVTGPRRSLSLKLSVARVYEPQIRAVRVSFKQDTRRVDARGKGSALPPWRQPRGKSMVYLVNSHTNATRIGRHLWEIDLRFAPGLPPGWHGERFLSRSAGPLSSEPGTYKIVRTILWSWI